MMSMISPLRLRIDLFIQCGLALLILFLSLIWSPGLAVTLLCLLAAWQMLSAIELQLTFGLRTRTLLLVIGGLALLAGLFTVSTFGILAWLPLAAVVPVHLLRTVQEYRIVRRRRRSFWDL